MSLSIATMCRTNSITLSATSAETPKSNQQMAYKLSPYPVSVLAALGELTLGLPLDRIKVGLQSGSSFREIIYPTREIIYPARSSGFGNPQNLLPGIQIRYHTQIKSNIQYWFAGSPIRFRTQIKSNIQYWFAGVSHRIRTQIKSNIKYWFAGHTPSIINRCFIYLPGITFLNSGYSNHIEPWICWAGGCSSLTSQIIVKPILVSAAISPYVSLFEGLKLAQQLGHQKVYPQEINKFISIGTHGYPSTTSQAPTTYQPSTYQIIRGVINSGRPGILFASFWPTFARETAFISGMCAIQPQITNYLLTAETDISGALFSPMMGASNTTALLSSETARVLGSLVASFACQTISQPFDVLKTRRESMPATRWSAVFTSIKEDIKNKGARMTLFSGWMPRCLRGVWTFYSVSVIRDWLS